MERRETVELPITGMDCAQCASHVKQALETVPGVDSADVLLGAEKAVVRLDERRVERAALQQAVEKAGYGLGQSAGQRDDDEETDGAELAALSSARPLLTVLGLVFGVVLVVVVVGEWLGLLDAVTERIPWPLMLAAIMLAGYPIFRNVLRAARRGNIISHTLMTVGMLAAIAVGEWTAAAVVVFFMRLGDYVESFTSERARGALKDLTAMAPRTARVERPGGAVEVPVEEVQPGDVVVVRPGEKIAVDGVVIEGSATVDQATITGESMPVEAGAGSQVFAATIARLGSLRVRAERVGAETTFGRVIRMVEEAEANRADVQRVADKFSGYYLPVVLGVAVLTFLLSGNALATAAVLLVACSCSFALATPVAMMASIGAAARRGLLIKGGKYLEALAEADVLLIDKTGTLTLGQPQITDVFPLNGVGEDEMLALAASAERDSEHPLAEAVRRQAAARGLSLPDSEAFSATPGVGVTARVNGARVTVGSRRVLGDAAPPEESAALEAEGKTLLYVVREGRPVGLMAAADTVRPETPEAVAALASLGIRRVELLTGDNERTAAALAQALGVAYQAELLPEDKIDIVRRYQAQGHRVVMVGDGVNDAPALAQADVGIAMGAAGTDVAIEAAHIALMRDDWMLVPQAIEVARRTLRVVRMNLWFTALYNVSGLTLAAFGLLPPTLAAAAQSLPDLGILANSSRLLRQR
ncbi:MAG: heavy metal translocating P-type ATPase [Chloroflexota bacterium]